MAALTLAMHGVFLLLLYERPPSPRNPAPLRALEGTWIRLTPFPLLPPPPDPTAAAPPDPGAAPERPIPPIPPPQVTPGTAITLPPQAGTDVEPPLVQAGVERPAAGIDWQTQARQLAVRRAEELEGPKTFSPPPVVLRQPCQPPKSSIEWKSDQNKSNGSAVLTLGWEPPPPNSHLFDDIRMKDRKPASSVPDPNVCD